MSRLEWLEELQQRLATDRTLFLEGLELPAQPHLQLQQLATPQLCMLMLSETNTLTRMRIKAQYKKRRKVGIPETWDDDATAYLHLVDFSYSLEDLTALSPAQLLCVGIHSSSTLEKRQAALELLKAHVSRNSKYGSRSIPRKRSHSPTLAELTAAKRENSPDYLAAANDAEAEQRIAAQQAYARRHHPARGNEALFESPLVEWINWERLAQIAWEPRLYMRQIDFAQAIDRDMIPAHLPPFTPLELKALRYSPQRNNLPPFPDNIDEQEGRCITDSLATDLEVLKYLWREDVPQAKAVWLATRASPGLLELIRALGKVLELRREARLCWDDLQSTLRSVIAVGKSREPVKSQLELVQSLEDAVALEDFFFPNGQAARVPGGPDLIDKIGDDAYARLRDYTKEWARQDES